MAATNTIPAFFSAIDDMNLHLQLLQTEIETVQGTIEVIMKMRRENSQHEINRYLNAGLTRIESTKSGLQVLGTETASLSETMSEALRNVEYAHSIAGLISETSCDLPERQQIAVNALLAFTFTAQTSLENILKQGE